MPVWRNGRTQIEFCELIINGSNKSPSVVARYKRLGSAQIRGDGAVTPSEKKKCFARKNCRVGQRNCPYRGIAKRLRLRILIPTYAGSNPAPPAKQPRATVASNSKTAGNTTDSSNERIARQNIAHFQGVGRNSQRRERKMSNFIDFIVAYIGFALVVVVVYGRSK